MTTTACTRNWSYSNYSLHPEPTPYRSPKKLLKMVKYEYELNNRFYRNGTNPIIQIDLQAQLVVTRRGIYHYSVDATGRPFADSYLLVTDDNRHFGARVGQMYLLVKRLLTLNALK